MKKVFLILGVSLALAGCKEEEMQPAKSVDYYANNEQEREAVLDRCSQDLADAVKDDDCINANTAANRVADERRDDAWEPGTNLGKPEL